jgi:cell division septation protein DedD
MKFRTREFGRKVTPRFLNDNLDFGSAGEAVMSEEIREGSTMKVVSIGCRPTGALERQIVSVLERPRLLVAQNTARPLPAKLPVPAPRAQPKAKPEPEPEPQKVTAPKKLSPQFAAAVPQPRKQFSPPNPPAPKRAATKQSLSSKVPLPAKYAPAKADNTAWRIQLSALRSQSNAESAWNKLQQATPDLLSELTLRVQKVELSKGTFFRVQAGPLADRQSSVSLCNKLKKRNQDCLVVAP